jgi:hypothetical protein
VLNCHDENGKLVVELTESRRLFAVYWEVVQSVGRQALGLIILVRVQASQPILTPSPRKREIQ